MANSGKPKNDTLRYMRSLHCNPTARVIYLFSLGQNFCTLPYLVLQHSLRKWGRGTPQNTPPGPGFQFDLSGFSATFVELSSLHYIYCWHPKDPSGPICLYRACPVSNMDSHHLAPHINFTAIHELSVPI